MESDNPPDRILLRANIPSRPTIDGVRYHAGLGGSDANEQTATILVVVDGREDRVRVSDGDTVALGGWTWKVEDFHVDDPRRAWLRLVPLAAT